MTRSVAAIKLVEFGTRSLLVLLCIYVMPAVEAARFGTVMLLVGLFGFLAGFERYVDLQRRLHALSSADSDAAILSFGRLVMLGYLFLVPLLYALLRQVSGITQQEAILAVVVAVVEHLSQESYRIVLVTSRYRPLLLGSAAKTVAILTAVTVGSIVRGHAMSLESVLSWWASIGCLWLLLTSLGLRSLARSGRVGEPIALRTQCIRSGRHFAIGLVAILSIQADRFVAIRILGAEDLACYFRAVMTAGAAYQILTFGSFNRIALDAYRSLRSGAHGAVRAVFRRERAAYLLVLVAVPVATDAARRFIGIPWIEASIPPFVVVALACCASLVRGLADFESIVLNHLHLESRVLSVNTLGALATVVAVTVLGSAFGLCGLLAGSVVGSCVVAIALWLSARRSLARSGAQFPEEPRRA